MPNLSDKFTDSLIERGVQLERLKAGSTKDIAKMMVSLERDIAEKIASIDPTGTASVNRRLNRLKRLKAQTRELIDTQFTEMNAAAISEVQSLGQIESQRVLSLLNQNIGVDLINVSLDPGEIRELAKGTLVAGAQSQDWWKRQSRTLQNKFEDQMRMGVLAGEPNEELIRRVRGTRGNNFKDGIMNVRRAEAEALVRTSVQNVSNQVRLNTYSANHTVLAGVQWVSTLDDRTTDICVGLSGLSWIIMPDGSYKPDGHDRRFPGPTAHWQCRSTQAPRTKSWAELSGKKIPTKAGGRQEFQKYFEQELARQGKTPAQIKSIRAKTRASMNGQVAKDITFDEFFSTMSVERQNKMLGSGRARLFREGKIRLSQLIDQRSRPLTLAQLEQL